MSESLIVGTVLSAPEAGWQRINNTTTTNGFSYTNFSSGSNANFSSGTQYFTTPGDTTLIAAGAGITINFTGTKLRILGAINNNGYPFVASVFIDNEYYGQLFSNATLPNMTYQLVLFEKLGLKDGLHSLYIKIETNSYRFFFDSIDIEDGAVVSSHTYAMLNQQLYNNRVEGDIDFYNTLFNADENTVLSCKYSMRDNTSLGIFHDIEFVNTPKKYWLRTPCYTEIRITDYFSIYESASPSHKELYSVDGDKFSFKFHAVLEQGETVNPNDYKAIIEIDEHNNSLLCIPKDIVLKSNELIPTDTLEPLTSFSPVLSRDDIEFKFLVSPDNETFYYYNTVSKYWATAIIEEVLDDNKAMTVEQFMNLSDTAKTDFPGSWDNIGLVIRVGIKKPDDVDHFDYMSDNYSIKNFRFNFVESGYKKAYTYNTKILNFRFTEAIDSDIRSKGIKCFVADNQINEGISYDIIKNNSLLSDNGYIFTNSDYTVQMSLGLPEKDTGKKDYPRFLFYDNAKFHMDFNETYEISKDEYAIKNSKDVKVVDTSLTTDTNYSYRPKLYLNVDSIIPTRIDTRPYLPIVTSLKNIEPGECIACTYTASANTVGTFTIGDNGKKLIPDYSKADPDGYFYFICVGYDMNGNKKLVADRNIQHSISWETLNTAGLCVSEGKAITLANRPCHLRLFNTSSASTAGVYDLNEWDAIISYYNKNNVLPSAIETWNAQSMYSWTLTTPVENNSNRIVRGKQTQDNIAEVYTQPHFVSTTTSKEIGFRPILLVEPVRGNGITYPECTLTIAKNIASAKPGQAVICDYKANAQTFGEFNFNASSLKNPIAVPAEETPDGRFYWICVGYSIRGFKKFVADRNIQSKISWEQLNTAGLCVSEGVDISDATGFKGSRVRLMVSDVTNYDMDMSSSEWDAIIMKETIGNSGISASGCNYWNMKNMSSWMLNTPHDVNMAGNPPSNSDRVIRGKESIDYSTRPSTFANSTLVSTAIGFRPVMEVDLHDTSVINSNNITVVTPYEKNTTNEPVVIAGEFEFLDDTCTFDTTEIKLYINGTQYQKFGPNNDEPHVVPTDYNYSLEIPISEFVYGTNTIKIVIRTTNDSGLSASNSYEYTINREQPKTTTKTRIYPIYGRGYDLGNTTNELDKLVNEHKATYTQADKEMEIPANTIKITFTEG